MTKILDCTIRDGGHLCDWNFDKFVVDETYQTACKSGVEYFEYGYRMHKNCRGLYSVCPDEILPDGSSEIVVMVNVSDFDINDFAFGGKFIVRVACHCNEIAEGMCACEMLADRGYRVFLHVMNIDKVEDYDLLKNWKNKDILISLYFADSFGALEVSDIEFYYKKLRDLGYENISFHGHNNLQLAFANTLKAIELGAYSVDASAFGMGRGAGNLPMELLLGKIGNNRYYNELVRKYFIDLHKKYNWGYSLETVYTGLNNIHPSKILV